MATTLTGANQKTEWFDLRAVAETACFLLTGDFDQAVDIHYSNLITYSKESGYTVGASSSIWPPTSAGGPFRLPFGLAKFVRFASGASWTASTECVPSFSPTKNSAGLLFDIAVQDVNE